MTGSANVLPLEEFSRILDSEADRLSRIPEQEAAKRPSPGKWSAKEVLGHLIDSASNNHQRFVRAQHENGLKMPSYAQNEWVSTENFQQRPWNEIVALWISYNRHLLHVMTASDPSKLANRLTIGDGEPVTLEFVMTDYVRHMKHHLAQIH